MLYVQQQVLCSLGVQSNRIFVHASVVGSDGLVGDLNSLETNLMER